MNIVPLAKASFEVLERRQLLCGLVHAGQGHLVDTTALTGTDLPPGEPAEAVVGTGNTTLGLPGLPELSSRPGAPKKLVLDFDGETVASWGSFSNINNPVFDTDGNPASFGANEQQQIEYIWARVAEKYAPFNVDVTTVDTGNLNNGVTLKACIGGNGSWYGQAGVGGVAYVNGFTNGLPNIVWIFSQVYGSPVGVAETVAHESGHGFGLQHQSLYDANGVKLAEYSPGSGNRAPIMGNSGSSPRGMWWLGQSSTSASIIQDDLAIISGATNGFGYRPDDHTNVLATATNMTVVGNESRGNGLIERETDADLFRFTVSAAGPLSVRTAVATSVFGQVGVLDSTLEVLNSSGTVIASAGTADFLNEGVIVQASPGTYYARVKSHGNYADLGQYSVIATFNPDSTPPSVTASNFTYQNSHQMTVSFTEDVSGSLTTQDLEFRNLTDGQTYFASNLTYQVSNNTATLRFDTALPDGNYLAVIPGGSVGDVYGNSLTGEYTASPFFVLAGDANHDRRVDISDFGALASNFNRTNRLFAQGDFNYSTVTDIDDFGILANKFNYVLPAARALPASGAPAGQGVTYTQTDRAADGVFGETLVDVVA